MNKKYSKIKKGDTVKFVEGGTFHPETRMWWKIAGLRKGGIYKVTSERGDWIRLEDHMYSHSPKHFIKVSGDSVKTIAKTYNI